MKAQREVLLTCTLRFIYDFIMPLSQPLPHLFICTERAATAQQELIESFLTISGALTMLTQSLPDVFLIPGLAVLLPYLTCIIRECVGYDVRVVISLSFLLSFADDVMYSESSLLMRKCDRCISEDFGGAQTSSSAPAQAAVAAIRPFFVASMSCLGLDMPETMKTREHLRVPIASFSAI